MRHHHLHGPRSGRSGGWQQAQQPDASDAADWFAGRLPDGWFAGDPTVVVDRVVSVRNVAMWPDLEAAADELHRVVRPGGTVVIAWHGGTTPSRIARSLRLPEEALGRIERALRIHFSDVTRHQLAGLDVLKAVRSR